MLDYLSGFLSKTDIYAAKAIAKISMFIYQYRRELNMTQKAFAEMMGVTQGMVSKWESADYNFSIDNIAQIAEKLGHTFDIVFIPESEYLHGHVKNDYATSPEKDRDELAKIIDFIGSAA